MLVAEAVGDDRRWGGGHRARQRRCAAGGDDVTRGAGGEAGRLRVEVDLAGGAVHDDPRRDAVRRRCIRESRHGARAAGLREGDDGRAVGRDGVAGRVLNRRRERVVVTRRVRARVREGDLACGAVDDGEGAKGAGGDPGCRGLHGDGADSWPVIVLVATPPVAVAVPVPVTVPAPDCNRHRRRGDQDDHGHCVGSVTMEATAAGVATGSLGASPVVHGAASQMASRTRARTRRVTTTRSRRQFRTRPATPSHPDNSTVVTFAKTGGPGTVTGLAECGDRRTAVANKGRRQRRLGTDRPRCAGSRPGLWQHQLRSSPRERVDVDEHDGGLPHVDRQRAAMTTSAITVPASRMSPATTSTAAGGTVGGAWQPGRDTLRRDRQTATAPTPPPSPSPTTHQQRHSSAGTLNGSALEAQPAVAGLTCTAPRGSSVAENGDRRPATLTRSPPRSRTAHGNTVTSDNSTVVAFAGEDGAGTVAGLGQRHRPQRRRDQERDQQARGD